jgi:hypothetical protein
MKTEIRKKTIHYKRAVITNSHATLQEMLKEVLGKNGLANKAKSRREIINQDAESFRLLNHHKEYNGMFFGQLIFFEPGKSQPLVILDDDADYYQIDSIRPDIIDEIKKKSGQDQQGQMNNRREFLSPMLYFGALDNHLVIVQSQSLKSRDLEAHFSWLLGTCTNLLGSNNALILADKPTEETMDKVQKSPVKKVNIGTPIQTREEQVPDNKHEELNQREARSKKVRWIPCGPAANIIEAALGQDWFNTLNLEDSLDEANLQVNLEITYLRKTTRNGQRMLDNIATALRHLDETDIEISLQDGGKIKGGDLKLSGPISVKTMEGGLVDESDLYHRMHAWLVSKVRSNEIEVNSSSGEGEKSN